MIVITLYLRSTIDPNRFSAFEKYMAEEQPVIAQCGGKIAGYYVPTNFSGATNEGFGLIDFGSLAEYETYRSRLADHPLHKENVAALEKSGALISIYRALIRRVEPRSKQGR
jgi:NIPSNAP